MFGYTERSERGVMPGRQRDDALRMAVDAIKRGVAHEAIFYLQRHFGHDSARVELIENEWRRK